MDLETQTQTDAEQPQKITLELTDEMVSRIVVALDAEGRQNEQFHYDAKNNLADRVAMAYLDDARDFYQTMNEVQKQRREQKPVPNGQWGAR